MKGTRKHKISFVSEYPANEPDKLLANLVMKTKLGFDEAQYMGLAFGPTETDVEIKDGLLTIAPFSAAVNNGKFNFAANANFKQKPVLLKNIEPIAMTNIQIDETISQRLLMYLNPIFANAFNVSGIANFSCEKLAIPLTDAGKKDMQIVGTFAVDNLQLQPHGLFGQILTLVGAGNGRVNMRIHPTKFVLKDGVLKYDDMQLDIGDNPVNFAGAIGLDGTLDMRITLPYTLRGRTARVDKETEGARITLPLKGTIDKPQFDTARLLEDILKKELEEQIRKEVLRGLEKLLK